MLCWGERVSLSFVFLIRCLVSVTGKKLLGELGKLYRTWFQQTHGQLCHPVVLQVLGKWGSVQDLPLHPMWLWASQWSYLPCLWRVGMLSSCSWISFCTRISWDACLKCSNIAPIPRISGSISLEVGPRKSGFLEHIITLRIAFLKQCWWKMADWTNAFPLIKTDIKGFLKIKKRRKSL